MLAHAAERILSFGPWPDRRPVILACSGGADSTFLACAWRHVAQNKRDYGEIVLPEAYVVVVDHGHRSGSESDAIQAQGLYSGLGFEAMIWKAESPNAARETKLREHRYRALEQAAIELQASTILLAHHADDHAETVLLRILRGTGLDGLQGIPATRSLNEHIQLQRPLLDVPAEVIRQTLTEMGQAWIEDPTNADASEAARNHLRLHALPALEPLASATPQSALRRLSDEAKDWAAARDEILAHYEDWRSLPSYLRRCAIRTCLQEVGATVSPARLSDLEGALLRRGTALIDAEHRLKCDGGRLRREPTSIEDQEGR